MTRAISVVSKGQGSIPNLEEKKSVCVRGMAQATYRPPGARSLQNNYPDCTDYSLWSVNASPDTYETPQPANESVFTTTIPQNDEDIQIALENNFVCFDYWDKSSPLSLWVYKTGPVNCAMRFNTWPPILFHFALQLLAVEDISPLAVNIKKREENGTESFQLSFWSTCPPDQAFCLLPREDTFKSFNVSWVVGFRPFMNPCQITKVELTKCFAVETSSFITFAPFRNSKTNICLLVGANGAGKSNFTRAAHVVSSLWDTFVYAIRKSFRSEFAANEPITKGAVSYTMARLLLGLKEGGSYLLEFKNEKLSRQYTLSITCEKKKVSKEEKDILEHSECM